MNTDKGTIIGEAGTYRLIDLFDDLAGRMHTYGPNAVISFNRSGWNGIGPGLRIEGIQARNEGRYRGRKGNDAILQYINGLTISPFVTILSFGHQPKDFLWLLSQ